MRPRPGSGGSRPEKSAEGPGRGEEKRGEGRGRGDRGGKGKPGGKAAESHRSPCEP